MKVTEDNKNKRKGAGANRKRGSQVSRLKPKQDKREKRVIDPLTRLYVRFPDKLPEAHVIKELHPLIKDVALPRQKSARYKLTAIYQTKSKFLSKCSVWHR